MQLIIVFMVVATYISKYEPVIANNVEAHASAVAEAGTNEWEDIPHIDYEVEDLLHHPVQLVEDPLSLIKESVLNEVNAHPNLYDSEDVDAFLNDGLTAINFLNQRSNDWMRAYRLAIKTLRWRAKNSINQLDASQFPCDLFRLGLIFESGHTHHREALGEYVDGNPVIWIRLGALGSVIKHMEKFTPTRLISFAYSTVRSGASHTLDVSNHLIHPRRPRIKSNRPPHIENLSIKKDRTIQHISRSIAFWLNDWRKRNAPGSRATLVLDFENTDFAFSSQAMGQFLIGLDDHFPDLFDQIIGFRYKYKLRSLHSPISVFNRIFKSRIASSPETDRKLKFIRTEPQISNFMPRVDVRGYSMLPEHVSGECVGPSRIPPAGCQDDSNELSSSGLYDPQLWQAVHNEIYQLCRPRRRED